MAGANPKAQQRRRRLCSKAAACSTAVLLLLSGCLHTERVSQSMTGGDSDGASQVVAISGDGRYVAFTSAATNLVVDDTNGVTDLFVRDNATGTTERVSLEDDDTQLDTAGVTMGSISSDGRYATFATVEAAVLSDQDSVGDLFVRDRQAGTTVNASVPSGGILNTNAWGAPSRNGRFVAVSASGTGIFVRDLVAGTSRQVAPIAADVQRVSDDGMVVAVASRFSYLPGDSDDTFDVYVFDGAAGTTQRLTPRIAGYRAVVQHGANQLQIDLTPDGRYVTWSGLRDGVSPEAYVHDRVTGTTEVLPGIVPTPGSTTDPRELLPTLSDDGRYVAYARNGEDEYHRTRFELVVFDRQLGSSSVVETLPTWWPSPILLSGDGRWTAFTASTAEASSDGNDLDDVYLRYAHQPVVSAPSSALVGPGSHILSLDAVELVGTPAVEVSGGGVTVEGVVASPGHLEVSIEVSPSATPGPRRLMVRNQGGWPGRSLTGGESSCGNCLTVTG